MIASHSSSFMRSSRLSRVMPALLTRIATAPNRASIVDERRVDRARRRSRRARCPCPRWPRLGERRGDRRGARRRWSRYRRRSRRRCASASAIARADAARRAGDQRDLPVELACRHRVTRFSAARAPRRRIGRGQRIGRRARRRCACTEPGQHLARDRTRRRASRRARRTPASSRSSAPGSPPGARARRGSRRARGARRRRRCARPESPARRNAIVASARGEPLGRRLQQRAVERRRHRQQHAALRAARLRPPRSRARPPPCGRR